MTYDPEFVVEQVANLNRYIELQRGHHYVSIDERAVWLLTIGCHDERHTVGVYTSAEGAMADWTPQQARQHAAASGYPLDTDEQPEWAREEDGNWEMSHACADVRRVGVKS